MTLELHVLLWSHSQCCFHIERVADMLKANASAFSDDRQMDYVPLLIGAEAECDALADMLRPQVARRRDARETARESAQDVMEKARRQ